MNDIKQQITEAQQRAEHASNERARYDDALHRLSAMQETASNELKELTRDWPTLAAEAVLAGRPAMLETAEVRMRMEMLREFIGSVPTIRAVLAGKQNTFAERQMSENAGISSLEKKLRQAQIRDKAKALLSGGDRIPKVFDVLRDDFKSLTRNELARALELKPGQRALQELMR